ncbi:hypothetical protein MASR1M8_21050 [Thermomonas brevis]
MKLHRQDGLPDNPDFEPRAEDGWHPLPEPPAEKLQVYVLVPLALSLPVMIAAWALAAQLAGGAGFSLGVIGLVVFLLGIPVLVVVHEAIHLLLHPGSGRHAHSVLGASSKHGIVYALYFGEMTRMRYVAILLGPFIVLSVLPLLWCLATRTFSGWAAAVSLLNTAFACGDLLATWLILRGSPPGARMRNRGYYTWWRLPAA